MDDFQEYTACCSVSHRLSHSISARKSRCLFRHRENSPRQISSLKVQSVTNYENHQNPAYRIFTYDLYWDILAVIPCRNRSNYTNKTPEANFRHSLQKNLYLYRDFIESPNYI